MKQVDFDAEYGVAQVAKRFVLARKGNDGVASMSVAVTFDTRDELDRTVRAMIDGEKHDRTFGKLTDGKKFWVTRDVLGSTVMLGVGWSMKEADVDAVIDSIACAIVAAQPVAA